jgi:hypothetical protein
VLVIILPILVLPSIPEDTPSEVISLVIFMDAPWIASLIT